MTLEKWAIRHGVSYAALQELRALWLAPVAEEPAPALPANARTDEAAVQARVRVEAATLGLKMWRNNVGALEDKRGVPVRYGLCNDTKALNEIFKSADLIGINNGLITLANVGEPRGQLISRECKPVGWSWGDDPKREAAQLRWAQLVIAAGGDAKFVTGPGSF